MPRKAQPRVKAGTSKAAAEDRRLAFAHAYIANGRNGTQAAITAGFSPKGADVVAARLLGDVRVSGLVAQLTAEHGRMTGLTTERVLREVERLAFSDTRKLYRDDGSMKDPSEWDDDTAAAVGGVEVVEEWQGKGDERELVGHTKKVKIWDKGAALDKAMKHLGLYERDNAQRSDNLALQVVLVK